MATGAIEFQLSKQLLQAIAQSFVATLPSLVAHNHLIDHTQMHNGGTLPQLQAPLNFHNPSPTSKNHQGYNKYQELYTPTHWMHSHALGALHTICLNKRKWLIIMIHKSIIFSSNITKITTFIESTPYSQSITIANKHFIP